MLTTTRMLTTRVLLCSFAFASVLAQKPPASSKCPLAIEYLQSKAPEPAVSNVKDRCRSPSDKAFCESCYCSVSYTAAVTFGNQLGNMSAVEAQACGLSLSMALVQLGALDLRSAAALGDQCNGAIMQLVISSDVCEKYMPVATTAANTTQATSVGSSSAKAIVTDNKGKNSSGVDSNTKLSLKDQTTNMTRGSAKGLRNPPMSVATAAAANTSAVQQGNSASAQGMSGDSKSANSVPVLANASTTTPAAANTTANSPADVAAVSDDHTTETNQSSVSSGTTAAPVPADSMSVSDNSATEGPQITTMLNSSRNKADPTNARDSTNSTSDVVSTTASALPAQPRQVSKAVDEADGATTAACPFSSADIRKDDLAIIKDACDTTHFQRRQFCAACACALAKVQESLMSSNSKRTSGATSPQNHPVAARVREAAESGQDAAAPAVAAAACANEVTAAAKAAGLLTAEAADLLASDICKYVPINEKMAACGLNAVVAAAESGAVTAAVHLMVLTMLGLTSAWMFL